MRFKTIFNSAVFAVILGTTPNYSGQVAELEITSLTEQLSSSVYYKISIADYRRGWFSSEVDFHVEVPFLNTFAEADLSAYTTNDFTLHINHGPLVFVDGSVIVAAAAQEMDFRPDWSRIAEVDKFIGDQPLAHSTLITRFNGEISGTSKLPEIDYVDQENNLSVKMSGYSETFTYASTTGHYSGSAVLPQLSIKSSDGDFDMNDIEMDIAGSSDELEATFHIPQISVQGDAVTMNIDNIEMKIDGDKVTDYMWGGKSSFSIGAVQSNTAATAFSMDGFTLTSNTWDEGPVVHSDMVVDLPSMRFDEFEVTNGKFDAIFRNIDKKAFDAYYTLILGLNMGDANALQKMLLEEGENLGISFLQSSPEYIMRDFSFTLPSGTLASNMGIHFDGGGDIDLKDIQNLINRVTSEGQLVIPRSLAHDMASRILEPQLAALGAQMTDEQMTQVVQQSIDGFVAQGFLVEDIEGNAYRSEYSFENGKITLNGKVIDLPL